MNPYLEYKMSWLRASLDADEAEAALLLPYETVRMLYTDVLEVGPNADKMVEALRDIKDAGMKIQDSYDDETARGLLAKFIQNFLEINLYINKSHIWDLLDATYDEIPQMKSNLEDAAEIFLQLIVDDAFYDGTPEQKMMRTADLDVLASLLGVNAECYRWGKEPVAE